MASVLVSSLGYAAQCLSNPTLETKTCTLIEIQVGHARVGIVDTPGFDDDEDSDAEVLGMTATCPINTSLPLTVSHSKDNTIPNCPTSPWHSAQRDHLLAQNYRPSVFSISHALPQGV
jgi:hypothetical protein